jgi:alkylated DNA repair dioxygenase AlkB
MSQPDLFERTVQEPQGFDWRAETIGEAEEAALAERLADLPLQPFAFRGYFGNRRTASFGLRYDYDRRAVENAAPIPDFLHEVRLRLAPAFGVDPAAVAQILVTEYSPGAGIGWHRDKPQFGTVMGLSLLAPCGLRFRRREGDGWRRVTRPLPARSAYRLSGPARHEWEHSIAALDRLRFSITLRTLERFV